MRPPWLSSQVCSAACSASQRCFLTFAYWLKLYVLTLFGAFTVVTLALDPGVATCVPSMQPVPACAASSSCRMAVDVHHGDTHHAKFTPVAPNMARPCTSDFAVQALVVLVSVSPCGVNARRAQHIRQRMQRCIRCRRPWQAHSKRIQRELCICSCPLWIIVRGF